ANHQQIPVNRSKAGVNNYQRDGYMRVDGNAGSAPNYEPNSLNGPKEDESTKISPFEVQGTADSVAYDSENHYTQPGDLYRLMSEDEKTRLVRNFVDHMKPVEKDEIKLRQIEHFYKADPEWGERIAEGLGLSVPQGVK
ncbi:MAG TPA: catalase-related domain-containing protein, partial [Virgibacillus sp.]|nr:catalase-related domain-containing protein [Virgibacillus sp.]